MPAPCVRLMDSLTESEMRKIAKFQRDAGVQRLSSHFSWSEFCDERQRIHQEFVYDTAMFAVDRGFRWSDVIRVATTARNLFPQLEGLDSLKLFTLMKDSLCECLPTLNKLHRYQFTQYLINLCTAQRWLFQAVVGGDSEVCIIQRHLEFELPPTLYPLAQGIELHEWEYQQEECKLMSELQQKEDELQKLRNSPRVTVEIDDVPDYEQLKEEDIETLVRAAVKATEGQILRSLEHEAALLKDILLLTRQHEALSTRRRQISPSSNSEGVSSLSEPQSKAHTSQRK